MVRVSPRAWNWQVVCTLGLKETSRRLNTLPYGCAGNRFDLSDRVEALDQANYSLKRDVNRLEREVVDARRARDDAVVAQRKAEVNVAELLEKTQELSQEKTKLQRGKDHYKEKYHDTNDYKRRKR